MNRTITQQTDFGFRQPEKFVTHFKFFRDTDAVELQIAEKIYAQIWVPIRKIFLNSPDSLAFKNRYQQRRRIGYHVYRLMTGIIFCPQNYVRDLTGNYDFYQVTI